MDIKEWWDNATPREKQIVISGGVITILALIYLFVWMPLNDALLHARREVTVDSKLLAWMKEADTHIQSVTQTASAANKTSSSSRLSLVQKRLTAASLSAAQLRQMENGEMEIAFQKVIFDKLIQWLVDLNQKDNIVILKMSVTPTPTSGLVSATIVLK